MRTPQKTSRATAGTGERARSPSTTSSEGNGGAGSAASEALPAPGRLQAGQGDTIMSRLLVPTGRPSAIDSARESLNGMGCLDRCKRKLTLADHKWVTPSHSLRTDNGFDIAKGWQLTLWSLGMGAFYTAALFLIFMAPDVLARARENLEVTFEGFCRDRESLFGEGSCLAPTWSDVLSGQLATLPIFDLAKISFKGRLEAWVQRLVGVGFVSTRFEFVDTYMLLSLVVAVGAVAGVGIGLLPIMLASLYKLAKKGAPATYTPMLRAIIKAHWNVASFQLTVIGWVLWVAFQAVPALRIFSFISNMLAGRNFVAEKIGLKRYFRFSNSTTVLQACPDSMGYGDLMKEASALSSTLAHAPARVPAPMTCFSALPAFSNLNMTDMRPLPLFAQYTVLAAGFGTAWMTMVANIVEWAISIINLSYYVFGLHLLYRSSLLRTLGDRFECLHFLSPLQQGIDDLGIFWRKGRKKLSTDWLSARPWLRNNTWLKDSHWFRKECSIYNYVSNVTAKVCMVAWSLLVTYLFAAMFWAVGTNMAAEFECGGFMHMIDYYAWNSLSAKSLSQSCTPIRAATALDSGQVAGEGVYGASLMAAAFYARWLLSPLLGGVAQLASWGYEARIKRQLAAETRDSTPSIFAIRQRMPHWLRTIQISADAERKYGYQPKESFFHTVYSWASFIGSGFATLAFFGSVGLFLHHAADSYTHLPAPDSANMMVPVVCGNAMQKAFFSWQGLQQLNSTAVAKTPFAPATHYFSDGFLLNVMALFSVNPSGPSVFDRENCTYDDMVYAVMMALMWSWIWPILASVTVTSAVIGVTTLTLGVRKLCVWQGWCRDELNDRDREAMNLAKEDDLMGSAARGVRPNRRKAVFSAGGGAHGARPKPAIQMSESVESRRSEAERAASKQRAKAARNALSHAGSGLYDIHRQRGRTGATSVTGADDGSRSRVGSASDALEALSRSRSSNNLASQRVAASGGPRRF